MIAGLPSRVEHGRILQSSSARIRLARIVWPTPVEDSLLTRSYSIILQLSRGPYVTFARFDDETTPMPFDHVGAMCLIPPNRRINIKSSSRNQVSIACSFEEQQILAWLDCEPLWTPGLSRAFLNFDNKEVRALLLRINKEIREPERGGAAMVDLLTQQLAIEIGRHCGRIVESGPVAGGLAPWRLRLIDELLIAPGPRPTLTKLAEVCRLSVRQLTRGFRESRGESIGSHVATLRMREAQHLLASDEGLKAIAHDLGYRSLSHFHRDFKRSTGISPNEYRLHLRWRT